MTESPKRGLAAALRKSRAAAPGADRIALWLVFFAGAITVLKKAGVSIPEYAVWFGVALGIAALLYEMTAGKDLARAWWHARPGSMLASFAIWFCAFAFSINNWIGAASESQVEKSNTHKAALIETQAVTGNLADAAAKVERLTKDRSLMKPTQSVQAARAVVQTSEAHKWFKGVTEGCTVTKGPQTREFCGKYLAAVADVDLWGSIADQEIKIGDAEAELKAARLVASSAKIETSEARGDLVLLTKWAGLAEADAATLNGLFAIVVVSIFLSFGSMRSEIKELSKTGARTPFDIFGKLGRLWGRVVNGTEPLPAGAALSHAEPVHAPTVNPARFTGPPRTRHSTGYTSGPILIGRPA